MLFPCFSLYLIADRELDKEMNMEKITREAILGGTRVIQLRYKKAGARDFLRLAEALRKITKDLGAAFIVNDRVDIALACGADGVHLGPDDMPPGKARKILGKEKIIGVTVKNRSEAREAEREGATYVAASHVFPTNTKRVPYPPIGLEGLKEIKESVSIPVVAVSGMNRDNAYRVIAAGADCIAVCSAIMLSPDPGLEASKIAREIERGKKSRDEERSL